MKKMLKNDFFNKKQIVYSERNFSYYYYYYCWGK